MQHAQNDRRARIVSLDAIDDQVRQSGNHQISRVRRADGSATERKVCKLLYSRQYPAADWRGGGRVLSRDPFDYPEKIVVRRLRPADRHGRGATIRSKAATTI